MMERPSEISLEEQRDIAVMERDVWKARAEAAESDAAETRAINGSLHAAMVRETVRADAAERELERHRHGVTIESDFVCPDSLALVNALGEAERLRAERDEWAGSAGRWCAAETAAIAEAERLRNLVLAMVEYKDGRDAGRPKDEGFVRAWLDTARALAAAGKEGG
jgi:hypothetical protein